MGEATRTKALTSTSLFKISQQQHKAVSSHRMQKRRRYLSHARGGALTRRTSSEMACVASSRAAWATEVLMSSWFESVALFPNRSSDFWEESYSTKSSVDSMSGKKKKKVMGRRAERAAAETKVFRVYAHELVSERRNTWG